MANIIKSIILKTCHAIKSCDIFGKKITLNYKGNEKHQTFIGGYASILFILTILGYTTYLLRDMFRKDPIVYSTSRVIKDLTTDTTEHKPADHGFAVALGFRYRNVSLLDEELLKKYKVAAYQYHSISDPVNGGWINNWTELDLVKCGENFPYKNKTLLAHYNIDNYVCIKPTNYSLLGNWYTDIGKELRILIDKCTSYYRDDCDSDEDIYSDVFKDWFDIIMVDNYFDPKDFTNPIKSYLTQKHYHSYQKGFTVHTDIFLKENKVSMQEGFTNLEGENHEKFYSVASEKFDKYASSSSTFGRIYIHLDPEVITHERSYRSIYDVLGNIGGITSLLNALTCAVVGFYSDIIFKHKTISNIYTFDVDEIDKDTIRENINEDEENSKREFTSYDKNIFSDNLPVVRERDGEDKKDCNQEDEKDRSEEDEKDRSGEDEKNRSEEDEKDRSEEDEKQQIENPVTASYQKIGISPDDENLLKKTLESKRRYAYSNFDVIFGFLFCCRKLFKKKQINYDLYQKGLKRYYHDLDAVNIISNLHQLNIMMKVVFNERQQILSSFSNLRSLEDDTSKKLRSCGVVSKYKHRHFKAKYSQQKESIKGLIENMRKSTLSNYDKLLIAQIDPKLSETMNLLSIKEKSFSVTNSPMEHIRDNSYPSSRKYCKKLRKLIYLIELHFNKKGTSKKSKINSKEEDLDSLDIPQESIQVPTGNTLLSKTTIIQPATNIHHLNKSPHDSSYDP
ncbi:unnamed protein product [Moneuplotes crassus]|uniref:Uncharacterized protein n=1 Tax=Euplotes crassus TaxID=5936 RepID=A0AAD1Y6N1_EUPCR|nr:unnamed protein product [Moneuplotes crassus]